MSKKVELVRQVAQKYRAMAMPDKLLCSDYLEVAEALEAAAEALERRGHRGRRTVNGQTARK